MNGVHRATRYHDFSCGHRVHGHESKCAHLHGHNYRVHFVVEAANLDDVGRVLDFSAIKERLCEWVENEWDHKFLVFCDDPIAAVLTANDPDGVVVTTFNPTAENMAQYLVEEVGPRALAGTGCKLVACIVDETRKCSATFVLR